MTDPQRNPFPGNQIPGNLDPIALKILSFVPLPQTTAATSNYNYQSPSNQDSHRWDLRVDQIISARQNLFFRYSDQVVGYGVSSPLPPSNGEYYSGGGANNTLSRSFVLGYNYGLVEFDRQFHSRGLERSLVDEHVPEPVTDRSRYTGRPHVESRIFANVVITGYPSLGVTNVPNSDASQNRQLSGDVTWSKGSQSLKFGVQEYWLQTNFLSSQRSSGIFNFNGQYTKNALADFLLGAAYTEQPVELLLARPSRALDESLRAGRLEDHADAHREHRACAMNSTRPRCRRTTPFPISIWTRIPSHPVLVPAGSQGDSIADRALQNVNYKQWAPRLGVAYSLNSQDGDSRGRWNLLFEPDHGGRNAVDGDQSAQQRTGGFTTNKNLPPTLLLRNGFASNALSLANASNVELVSYDRKGVTPADYQWNFNIQRQLPGGILLEVGYYGNKLDHMWRQLDGNPAPPEPGNINANRPFTSTLVPRTGDTITLGRRGSDSERWLERLQRTASQGREALHKRPYFHRFLRLLENDRAGRHRGRTESAGLDGRQGRLQPGYEAAFRRQRGLSVAVRSRTELGGSLEGRNKRGPWRLELRADRDGQHGHAAERHGERQSVEYWSDYERRPSERRRATGSWPIRRWSEWFNTAAFARMRPTRMATRAATSFADRDWSISIWLSTNRSGHRAGLGAVSPGSFQCHEYAGAGSAQYRSGEPFVRADHVGWGRQRSSACSESRLLKQKSNPTRRKRNKHHENTHLHYAGHDGSHIRLRSDRKGRGADPNLRRMCSRMRSLTSLLAHPDQLLIIDVRRPDELTANGGFPVYLSIQATMSQSTAWIPKDRTIVTVSNHAARGGVRADTLAKAGFKVAGTIGAQTYEQKAES